jgi:hypothetical protein
VALTTAYLFSARCGPKFEILFYYLLCAPRHRPLSHSRWLSLQVQGSGGGSGSSSSGRHPVGRTTAKLEAGTECGSHHRRSINHSNHSGLRRCGCLPRQLPQRQRPLQVARARDDSRSRWGSTGRSTAAPRAALVQGQTVRLEMDGYRFVKIGSISAKFPKK